MLQKQTFFAVSFAVMALAGGANAATVNTDFTGLSSGLNVSLGGDFVADDLRIQNGRCNNLTGGSGASCAALNTGETTTISRTSGLGFTLNSFFYQLLGNSAALDVTYFDANGDSVGSDMFTAAADDFNDGGEVITPAFGGEIFSVLFDDTGTGNIRFDDLSFDVADVAPIPVPATGLLLLGSFGGFAFMRRRKKA